MTAFKIALGLQTIAVAMLAVPAVAPAANLVPPGNSAATQYTEAFPTAGGNATAGKGRGGSRSPSVVLGAGNARRLEAQGEQGRAAAEVAAETAPATQMSGAKGGKAAGGGGVQASYSQPGGSSGLGEVIAQATGSSSSGRMGLFLPILIAAALAGAGTYWVRQRTRRPPA